MKKLLYLFSGVIFLLLLYSYYEITPNDGQLDVDGDLYVNGHIISTDAIHAYCYFPESAVTLTISSSGTWYHVTNATNDLYTCELDGFTSFNDSIVISDHAGDYDFNAVINFQGQANQNYKARFWNVTKNTGVPVGSAEAGAGSDIVAIDILAYGEDIGQGGTIVLQMQNADGTGNATLKSGAIRIGLVHE